MLNGVYKYENKSHLLLNGLTFENFDYYTYTHYGVNEVLIDYAYEIYKPDGSKFWVEDENKFDLRQYKIVDRRQTNNTSNYVNEYDISNISNNRLINHTNYTTKYVDCGDFVEVLTSERTILIYLEWKCF